jgi:glycosyltransferase involved in cell wall biosynthesis
MDRDLGIVIPVYNEGENISATLDAIQRNINTPHRIYIVYDFDEDDTLPVARDFQKKGLDLTFIKNPDGGVTNAIKKGLRDAKEKYLLVSMADLSDDYAKVDSMCGLMNEGYDMVCGSRYMRGGRQEGGPLIKKAISRAVGVSLKYLAGLPTHDATNSFKLYRKSMLDSMEFESEGGFEIGMEILVKAHASGCRVAEIPCVWKGRQKGQSRFKVIGWAPNYLRWYFYALKRNLPDIYLLLLFLTACGLSVYFSSRGWWNKIIDIHSFRQTQTAISTYYLIKEGFTINYITPVFGAPWSVPMEFPTYQFIVAALVRITDMPLDQAGRAVSLAFHYLCLIPLYYLLRNMNIRRMHVAVVLSLVVASPLYAFWSRTFMIESTALFFSLMSTLFLLRAIRGWSVLNITGGILCGSLAALTKITTFSIFCVALFMIIVAVWFSKGRERFTVSITGRHLLYGILFLGVPLMAGLIWASHADSLKALNPIGNFNMSSKMHSWHFGTLEMRADLRIWRRIFGNYSPSILGSNLLFLLLPLAFFRKGFRLPTIICLLSFAVAVLVYTNMYWRHEYYLYANSIFLIVLLGLSVIALLERPKLSIVGFLLIPLIFVMMYSRYDTYYGPWHAKAAGYNDSLFQIAKTIMKEDEVMLVYGISYNPVIPYYSERKSIMPNGLISLEDPMMKKAIENTGRDKITAMVMCKEFNYDETPFVKKGSELFGLMPNSVTKGFCSLFGQTERVQKYLYGTENPAVHGS